MSFAIQTCVLTLCLFGGIILAAEIGRVLARRASRGAGEPSRAGAGAVEGAIFALVGLLVAFAFTSAAARFEARRAMINNEANAVGTAWLRMDLLDPGSTGDVRRAFADYVDARVRVHQQLSDPDAAVRTVAEAERLQGMIWAGALASSREQPGPYVPTLVLPALNQMFDAGSTRVFSVRTHLPDPILWLLIALVLLASMLAGHSMAARAPRNWFHTLIFASAMSIALYTIIDLEYPRLGLIRLDASDHALIALRDSIRASLGPAGG